MGTLLHLYWPFRKKLCLPDCNIVSMKPYRDILGKGKCVNTPIKWRRVPYVLNIWLYSSLWPTPRDSLNYKYGKANTYIVWCNTNGMLKPHLIYMYFIWLLSRVVSFLYTQLPAVVWMRCPDKVTHEPLCSMGLFTIHRYIKLLLCSEKNLEYYN